MSRHEQSRQNNAEAIKAAGFGLYDNVPTDLAVLSCNEPRRFCGEGKEGPVVTIAGRIILLRVMGKLAFATLRDHSGTMQVAFDKSRLSEAHWKLIRALDLSDIIKVTGNCGQTQAGESTIWAVSLSVGAKSFVPPPAKHEGLTNIEQRYRNRHVDLWANPEVMEVFRLRSEIIKRIRGYFDIRHFMEVETPVMQLKHGGAAAEPFRTHHNALDLDLSLRIAPELYLKRLLVGGLPRVYEIGKNFRNEGISPRHNPEFTALEAYEAWGSYQTMMVHTEKMLQSLPLLPQSFNLKQPFEVVSFSDIVEKETGRADLTQQEMVEVYERSIEPKLIIPTFVVGLPAYKVPLAKSVDGWSESFELVINGQEIGCGYSEQNDPEAQKAAFGGSDLDEDFVDVLKCGMPPAGGLGIGIDRLVALIAGVSNIRDVILFPLMRPEA